MHDKRIITIEARMGSTRLPGKVLLEVNGKSMLEIMITRLKLVPGVSQIVIATTSNIGDDPIFQEAQQLEVDCYRGSENNVQERVLEAAQAFGATEIVALTGDCPLIDPQIVELCIKTFEANDVDYLSNAGIRSYPDGMDTQVLRTAALEKSLEMAPSDEELEHVTLHIRRNKDIFRNLYLISPIETRYPKLGLTLDEEKDFLLITSVVRYFHGRMDFTCLEIIEFLLGNPEIAMLNSSVKRK
jgi:spore coat polysaccharide biosynthesis protein SpsF